MRLLFDYRFLKFFIFSLVVCYFISWVMGSFPSQFWQHELTWLIVGIITAIIYTFKVLNEKVSALEQVIGVMILKSQQEKENVINKL